MKALLITKCGCSRLADVMEGAKGLKVSVRGSIRVFNKADDKPIVVDGVNIEVFREE